MRAGILHDMAQTRMHADILHYMSQTEVPALVSHVLVASRVASVMLEAALQDKCTLTKKCMCVDHTRAMQTV